MSSSPSTPLAGDRAQGSDLQQAPEGPGRVVRLRAVVVREDVIVTAITKDGATALSDVGRRFDPTGRLGVERADRLQLSILVLRQKLDAHRDRQADRALCRLVFLPRLQRLAVVTHTAPPLGTLW